MLEQSEDASYAEQFRRIETEADVDALSDADFNRSSPVAQALVARHGSLRACFRHENLSRPVQIIPNRVEVPWPVTS